MAQPGLAGPRMRVAVLIVGYKNADDMARCLEALRLSTYTNFEVVVCENGGDAAYGALLKVLGSSSLISNLKSIKAPFNGGFAAGVNICSRAAPDADFYWILNPDTEPDSAAMEALVNKLSSGKCDAAGGVLSFPDGRTQSYGGSWIPWRGRFASIGYGSFPNEAMQEAQIERCQNFLSGASMMVGQAFLRRTGEMREDYFLYGEEVAWCIEAVRHGLRLGFCGDAKVIHYQGTSTGCTERLSDRSRISVYLGERNRILLTRDYFPSVLWPAAVVSLVDLCFRFGRHAAWRQLGYALAGWWAGIRDERGPAGLSV
jgi:N-acetylglucosaminyl-diphospho-decaprenol L-rhamnosyltransferase